MRKKFGPFIFICLILGMLIVSTAQAAGKKAVANSKTAKCCEVKRAQARSVAKSGKVKATKAERDLKVVTVVFTPEDTKAKKPSVEDRVKKLLEGPTLVTVGETPAETDVEPLSNEQSQEARLKEQRDREKRRRDREKRESAEAAAEEKAKTEKVGSRVATAPSLEKLFNKFRRDFASEAPDETDLNP